MKVNRFIRTFSVALAMVMLLSFLSIVSVSGAEKSEKSDDDGHVIYFNAGVSGWSNYSLIMVYCYCPATGEVLMDWMAKKKGGMTDMGNGIWSYDFDAKGITLDDEKQYNLVFLTDNGYQTQELLFDTTCFGDTVIPDDANVAEVPYDTSKSAIFAFWQSGKLGPVRYITEALRRGDYDGDNVITIMDATRVQNLIADILQKPSAAFLKAIDADGDGVLTIMDATRIQNVIAELMDMEGTKPDKAIAD